MILESTFLHNVTRVSFSKAPFYSSGTKLDRVKIIIRCEFEDPMTGLTHTLEHNFNLLSNDEGTITLHEVDDEESSG